MISHQTRIEDALRDGSISKAMSIAANWCKDRELQTAMSRAVNSHKYPATYESMGYSVERLWDDGERALEKFMNSLGSSVHDFLSSDR